ncbi:P-loop containing nucleoside triphosphate hydrolase protein [Mycena albidolilacea]|uniref:P-loop containing nucleoside triphosphate hydrolase protein n=1 Tax=Mycena albidolilacea TaxID=1033008 RepID=A0AAD7AUW5_9AGAR|nr:P-loop containing nucleoside triphosphate hydrolase protein [Mycena albidolilacea]
MSTSFTADEFVNIWVDAGDTNHDNEFYRQWSVHASAKHAAQPLQIANALKKAYPDHSLVLTPQNILGFPKALFSPLPDAPLVSKVMFIPGARKNGEATGWVVDQIDFAAFVGAWGNYDFLVYLVTYPLAYGTMTLFAILHQGPQDAARELILNYGLWSSSLHNEIWVYNQGFWQKDYALWQSIQTADWKDVILDDGFKKNLQKDIYGFFKSEPIYKDLAIPWKRGIIMHGPPGNGKTISIKVIMKTCDALGFAPLYVKSFQNYFGEEVAMQQVFDMARRLSPCVIVLEDLDALITDRNRSFFLNQLDGLQGNDGLLVIGTTNHFDRLDPGLSSRPSRFDRKYKFDDPTREERVLYVKYWQDKLESNKEIEFPDALVDEVADMTDQFSFAYLKEAFVSSLVTLAGYEGDDKPSFPSALKAQIKMLRKQLDKSTTEAEAKRDFRPPFDTLSDAAPVLSVFPPTAGPQQPTPGEPNFRALLDRLQQGRGNVPELMAQLEETRRAMTALSTPSAWDSSHTQIAGLAYYKAPTLN